ncbi:MAG: hypothetical protein JWM34_2636 [Ilumatobacteraceae bacterium]|nr:hypothetical protein [Ilumatobacteraceae bacterium]
MTVPPLPPTDPGLVDDHRIAHERLHRQVADRAPHAVTLFTVQQRRLVVESLAYVQPVVSRPEHAQVVVPPRAFLTRSAQRRMLGASVAFRHMDSRVTMYRSGDVPSVVVPSTPMVLHALLESAVPSTDGETNPGMLRTTLTNWMPEANDYAHPPAHMVTELVDEAIHVANFADAPACARAAWLTFTMLSIHPFVDGNGRTSRALYMAMVAPSLPLGIDWGSLEQWSAWRGEYVAALQAGQQVDSYDPANMSAAAFIDFATRASIDGANLCAARIEAIERRLDELERQVPRAHAVIETIVSMLGIATLAEVAACRLPAAEIDAVVADLIATGRLQWVHRPHGRRTMERPEPFGLVAG